MKRFFLTALLATIVLSVSALNYCQSAAFGYGRNATGGGNANPITVSNLSGLQNALNKAQNKVIIITHNITFTSMLSVSGLKNVTLLAMPGVKLISNQQDASTSGILFIKKSSNVIIRNITFEGPGAYDCDGNDLLCFEGVTDAWVDHCDFSDGCDGNFDNKSTTDNLTVSWCKFHYEKEPRAGGSGGADDHRFSNLLGSSSTQAPADGTYNVTWAYCWWCDGCRERQIRGRNASLHFLNCYWSSTVANYCIGPENMDAYVEGCYFDVNLAAKKIFYQNYGGTNGVTYVNSYAKKGGLSNISDRSVLVPSYSYTAVGYTEAQAMVTNATCGAGATLNITTAGSISSSCDSGTEPAPAPDTDPVITSDLTWCFSTSAFKDLGTLTSTTTINGLTIAASADKSVTIAAGAKTIGSETFTHVLKTGGTGSATARSLSFQVSDSCDIDVYLISANATSERVVNVYSGTYSGTPLTTLAATTTATKETIQYRGDATTIYLGSANSGVNFYGINITYLESHDNTEDEPEDDGGQGTITPVDEDEVVEQHHLTWNFSDSKFDDFIGSIATTKTVDNLTLVGKSGGAMTLEANDKYYVVTPGDTIFFSNRLKTGGTGKADQRILTFPVTGACTIDVYLMSGSSSSRTLNVWSGSVSTENILTALTVPTELTKVTYTYNGSATTIVLGSANSGLSIYAIHITYLPDHGTAIEETSVPDETQKILHNGQLLIRRDDAVYNVMGQTVR